MKQIMYLDDMGVSRAIGEIWISRNGDECYYRENGRLNVRTINVEPSLTIQSERDKCDLEVIRSIYAKSGVMNNIRTDQPSYGDFTSSRELHDVLFRAQQAQDEFMELDAHTRLRFNNDPGMLLDYVRDPKNAAEAVKLGLMKAPAASPQANQVPQGDKAPPSKEGG